MPIPRKGYRNGEGIVKINLCIGDGLLIDIPLMAQKACSLLRRSLETFVERGVELARVHFL
jgi:hypothetical protein